MINLITHMRQVRVSHAIGYTEQIRQMKRCLSSGMRPFEYFDCGMYLSMNFRPKDYVGIAFLHQFYVQHDPKVATMRYASVAEVCNDKCSFANELESLNISMPKSDYLGTFLKKRKSFFAKPRYGWGGYDIYECRYIKEKSLYRLVNSDTGDAHFRDVEMMRTFFLRKDYIFQTIVESSASPFEDYNYGCYRALVYFKNNEPPNTIGQLLRLSGKSNIVDNFQHSDNAIVGLSAISPGKMVDVPIIYGGNHRIHSSLKSDNVDKQIIPVFVIDDINADIAKIGKRIIAPNGVLLSFDIMLSINNKKEWSYYFLEANCRTGFSSLQIAQRTGLRSCLNSIHSSRNGLGRG